MVIPFHKDSYLGNKAYCQFIMVAIAQPPILEEIRFSYHSSTLQALDLDHSTPQFYLGN
jgi:hypothetical protein